MTTFVLIPGAGGEAWYWHQVEPLLREAGHDVVNVGLPAVDETAGLEEYTRFTMDSIGDRDDVVVVGQSMGGFTAPLVAAEAKANRIVLLNAMIPKPGETGGEWWEVTDVGTARVDAARRGGWPEEWDDRRDYFHDVPPEITEEAYSRPEFEQSDRPFADPWPLPAWPDIPTRVLAGRDDRLFPLEFQRKQAADRLGIAVVEIPGGHLAALSRPRDVVEEILRP